MYIANLDLLKHTQLCYLLILTASKLKVFGNDALRKATARCKLATATVNSIIEKNHIFFLVSCGCYCIHGCICLINEDIFKSSVMDVIKCIADRNL
jgi:hypothetical protein